MNDFVNVPHEPTEAMMKAACNVGPDTNNGAFSYDDARTVFVAMLSAAPAPEGGAVSIWSDARSLFVRYAELFALTERYEEASAIADKAAREIEALATREEAPAGAGEWITGDQLHEIMQTFTDRADVSEIAAKINAAIATRAQPPAREDAQPVDVDQIAKVIRASGIDRGWAQPGDADEVARRIQALGPTTHSAPDALRVAVEALEPFARAAEKLDGLWSEDDWRWNDSVRSGVTVRDIRRASQALAALQAEQGAK